MKLPKIFVPKKDLEWKLDELLKHSKDSDVPNIQELVYGCEEFLKHTKNVKLDGPLIMEEEKFDYLYSVGNNLSNYMDYTLDDIRGLSDLLGELKLENSLLGYYLSILINKVIEDDDELEIPYLGEGLGTSMTKGTLIINGDAGDALGYCMQGGKIVVRGNAGNRVGNWMKDGMIVVRNDIGDYTGFFSSDGSIVVGGNAGDDTGAYLEGGDIMVMGNVGMNCAYKMSSGTIRIRGNLGIFTGYAMAGGEIYLEKGSTIEGISTSCRGKIYQDNRVIWSK